MKKKVPSFMLIRKYLLKWIYNKEDTIGVLIKTEPYPLLQQNSDLNKKVLKHQNKNEHLSNRTISHKSSPSNQKPKMIQTVYKPKTIPSYYLMITANVSVFNKWKIN